MLWLRNQLVMRYRSFSRAVWWNKNLNKDGTMPAPCTMKIIIPNCGGGGSMSRKSTSRGHRQMFFHALYTMRSQRERERERETLYIEPVTQPDDLWRIEMNKTKVLCFVVYRLIFFFLGFGFADHFADDHGCIKIQRRRAAAVVV